MQCLILAGGLGTRLFPATRTVPKVLVEVAGRPFAHWQLEWLASEGVERVVYSVGHLGEMIEAEIGDGARWGVAVTYVDEGRQRLGTGGALRLAVDAGALDDTFFVLYGDSYLSVDLSAVEDDFCARAPDALMTVYRNAGRFETNNAVVAHGMVTHYEKGLAHPPPEMQFVDYGLSVLRGAVVVELVPAGGASDLADAFSALSAAGRLAGFEASTRFFEIGSPSGLTDLERHLDNSADEVHHRQ
ncbi:MAG TPA: sugar phosphate nucleotidyltransferase [Acidimicrobiales bacterium]